MAPKISLSAKEQRTRVDGFPIGPADNQPWKQVTAEGLKAESLLRVPEYVDEHQLEKVQESTTGRVVETMGWQFEMDPQGSQPVIMDVIRQGGQIQAIMEWTFGHARLSGLGGNGETWEEARDTMDISGTEAQMILREMGKGMEEAQVDTLLKFHPGLMDRNPAYRQAIGSAGLDDAAIGKRQLACLKERGLDWGTLNRGRAKIVGRILAEQEAASA